MDREGKDADTVADKCKVSQIFETNSVKSDSIFRKTAVVHHPNCFRVIFIQLNFIVV